MKFSFLTFAENKSFLTAVDVIKLFVRKSRRIRFCQNWQVLQYSIIERLDSELMGDEGSYLPNCQTNLDIALQALSLLLCNFINTTAYTLGQIQAFISSYPRVPWLGHLSIHRLRLIGTVSAFRFDFFNGRSTSWDCSKSKSRTGMRQ